jgi:hypothetical protein
VAGVVLTGFVGAGANGFVGALGSVCVTGGAGTTGESVAAGAGLLGVGGRGANGLAGV